MTLHRRNLLKLTGAAAAAAVGTTAGCLETVGLDDGEVPAYATWLHLDADDDVVFAYVDWAALEALDDPDPEEGDEDADDWGDHEDAMIAYPMLGAFVGIVGAGFGLWGTGLMGLVQPDEDADDEDEPAADDFETNVEEILWVNDALVLAGEIDTEEIAGELTTVPDDVFAMEREHEQRGEIGDFARYEPVEGDEDAMGPDVLAVSEEAIVFASDDDVDAAELVRGPIEAREGDGAADAEPDVEWLLEEAGHGQLAFGGYADDADDEEATDGAEFDHLEGATGVCSSLDLEDDGATGAFAALGDDLAADEDELEGVLGTSAAEATIEVDDGRVTASATWEEDVTDEQA
ncbi:hypothetical protein CV102_08550 [Natronococcus pandeyae]|uniref:Uncharacterized protein n=1 Tax=Natronococcus pandeyae TaxID=2055836 RepID=A0A8J8Q4T1_9EURY|nr:hypothetical protein [Natronococcus pandeyae]TYL39316.1 hypothetical protein CV102_08550 [Natronococcus pandeyae]